MSVSHQNAQAGALSLDNVIEFPRRANPRAMADTGTPTALVHLWNRAGSQPGLDGVPVEVLDTLQRLKDADRPGALCVLRLNDYRLLEETFGRRIGQQLLQLVGHRLQAGLRGQDLLEQIAEDEFVLILDGQADSEQLAAIAQRLLNDCSGVYTLEGLRMHVNASLGIARFPVDAGEAALLLRFARIALHETEPGSPSPYHFFSQKLLEQRRPGCGWPPNSRRRWRKSALSCTTSRCSISRPSAPWAPRRCCGCAPRRAN